MIGQKLFKITKALVNLWFILLIGLGSLGVMIQLFQVTQTDPSTGVHRLGASISFEVRNFAPAKTNPGDINNPGDIYSRDTLAVLDPSSNRFLLKAAYHSPIGYFNFFSTLLFLLVAIYGTSLLRNIFNSFSVQEPFTVANARRVRNIGLLLIATDLIKIIYYYAFSLVVNQYFSGEHIRLITQIGSGIWLGLIVLSLSIVYRRGVDIYLENKLTI
jgi:hypothetical protein